MLEHREAQDCDAQRGKRDRLDRVESKTCVGRRIAIDPARQLRRAHRSVEDAERGRVTAAPPPEIDYDEKDPEQDEEDNERVIDFVGTLVGVY